MGEQAGGEGPGAEPKAGFFMHLNRKVAIVCSLKYADIHSSIFRLVMVANSSLTPIVALLVHPRGTTHSIVDCHEFTGSQK